MLYRVMILAAGLLVRRCSPRLRAWRRTSRL
jgi:hypothetical protein